MTFFMMLGRHHRPGSTDGPMMSKYGDRLGIAEHPKLCYSKVSSNHSRPAESYFSLVFPNTTTFKTQYSIYICIILGGLNGKKQITAILSNNSYA